MTALTLAGLAYLLFGLALAVPASAKILRKVLARVPVTSTLSMFVLPPVMVVMTLIGVVVLPALFLAEVVQATVGATRGCAAMLWLYWKIGRRVPGAEWKVGRLRSLLLTIRSNYAGVWSDD